MAKYKTLKTYFSKFYQILNKFRKKTRSAFFDDIARRAFVNNAFDGALTVLGILMGNIIIGEVSPRIVIYTGFGACLAMGVSGAFGRYLSERAERKRALNQMGSYIFTDLSGSIIERESKKKVFMISLVDGLSPSLAAGIPLIPFFLAQATIISLDASVIASFSLDFLVLFILGGFLGKISGENIVLHGVIVVLVGFLTGLMILLGSIFLLGV